MTNVYDKFKKYENTIINEIVLEFGIEYEEYIRSKFKNIKFIFETPPREEYFNIKEMYNETNLLEILSKYYEWRKLEFDKKKIFNLYIKLYIDKWISCFIELGNNKDYDKITNLFSSYQPSGILIDYFSSEYNLKLTNDNLNDSLISYINSKRNKFISTISEKGYQIKSLNNVLVDLFIKWRNQFVRSIMIEKLLFEKDSYISRISNIINDNNIEIINDVIMKENPTCIKYIKKNNEYNCFIFLPVSRVKRRGNKTIDVILIHEMLHYLQQFTDKEVILNEILVQFKATKITERLHNKGIYIFDNKCDAKIQGECIYEVLFPFAKVILECDSQKLINKCLFDDNYYQLNQIFGDNIYQYILLLDKLYKDIFNHLPFNNKSLEELDVCISQMTNYFLSNNSDEKKRILSK